MVRWPDLLAILLYGLWLVNFGWHRMNEGPTGVHQWSQTDRQALILRFAEPGSNIFQPRTYHLITPDGITSVDPPLVEWLTGMTMRITGIHGPILYRGWMLLLHMLALWFLWGATSYLTTHPAIRLVLSGGILLIPMYSYYALSYLPSAQAFSIFLIGLSQWLRYRFTGKGFWIWVAIGILCFWIRMPFILAWLFMWLILVVEAREASPRIRWAATLSVLAFCGQWLLKQWMTQTYGTQFLAHFLPADGFVQGLQTWWSTLHFWMDQVLSPTQWIGAFLMLAAGLWYQNSRITRIIYLSTICAGLTIYLLYSLLLTGQLSAHEYYFLDVFLPVILVMLTLAAHVTFSTSRLWPQWLLVLFLPLWFYHARVIFQTKDQVAASQGADRARRELRDCRVCLDAMGIPLADTILTFETYTTNGGLIACGRRGFSSLSTNPVAVREDLKRPASVVVIPRSFLLSEVYQDYPPIGDWLIRSGGDEHIAVFRKLNVPIPGNFARFMVVEGQDFQHIPLHTGSMVLPDDWAWDPQVDTLARPWQLPANQEFGPTLRLVPGEARHLAVRAKVGTRNGDHAVSWACDMGQKGQTSDIRYGSIPLSHEDSLAWRAWETDIPAGHEGAPVILYLWNGGGAHLVVDSLEVLLW